jgi:deazaflavin-dependent oxidoreductase (nitroreductase family)
MSAKSLKQPKGALRFGLRLPIWLYRLHLGWLLGERFLLLTHTGRHTGKPRQTVIEVVKHDRERADFYVVSGWGPRADWYRNIHAQPQVLVQAGRHRWHARAEDVPLPQAVDILEEYTRRYPLAFKELTGFFLGEQLPPGRESSERLAASMPMIVFRAQPDRHQVP